MKKTFLLILSVLLLTGCSVREQEMDITVFGSVMSSVYTGKVKRKVPDGEGSAQLQEGASVSGQFEGGVFMAGETENVPYVVSVRNETYSGTYTGEAADQMPCGSGAFESDDYSYDGTWADGVPQGSGRLEAKHFVIDTPSEKLEGSYAGEVKDGLAEGNGTFIYQSGSDEIEMEGTFAGNQFDGLMKKTVHYPNTDKTYPVNYQGGKPIDDTAGMIAYLEGMRNQSYCLSESQMRFIFEHADLFNGTKTDAGPSAAYSSSYNYTSFNEADAPDLIRIPNALVKSVQRYKPYEGSDTVTSMIVQNSDGYYHLVFAYSVDAADRDETVDICALPLCRSTLSTPDGDYEAIDAAGAMIITR